MDDFLETLLAFQGLRLVCSYLSIFPASLKAIPQRKRPPEPDRKRGQSRTNRKRQAARNEVSEQSA